MRIVLDTNVLVSGILNPHGPPGRIVDAVLRGELALLVDDRIVSEYREVLLRPKFGLDFTDVDAFMAFINASAEFISACPLAINIPDLADRPFLEVAVAGIADRLVTGNIRHFEPCFGELQVKLSTPKEFLEDLIG